MGKELLQVQQLLPLLPQPQRLRALQLRPHQLLLDLDLDLLAAFNGGSEMVSVIQKTIRRHVDLMEVIAALLTLTHIGTGHANGLTNVSARNEDTTTTTT